MNKNSLIFFLKSLLLIGLCGCIGTLLLFAAYTLPTKDMFRHVKSSVSFYQNGGEYPTWAVNAPSSRLDNWTDSTMLLSAIHPVNSIAKDAMIVPSVRYKGYNPTQSLIKRFYGEEKGIYVREYSRYWHGYLVIVKPLLYVFPLSHIRLFNMYAQLLLAFYVFSLFYKEFGYKYTMPFILSYLVLNPISLVLSFQYSTMFYVSLFVIVLLNKIYKKGFEETSSIYFVFLLSGVITSYFDLLTYPLLSLTFPLITLLLMIRKHEKIVSNKMIVGMICLNSFFWGIGYGGMFISKWLVATLITGNDVFSIAVNFASARVTPYLNYKQIITPLDAIWRNIKVIYSEPSFIIFVIGVIAFAFLSYKLKGHIKGHIIVENNKVFCLSFGIIALLPIVWYSVFFNHSYVHFWFTYRNLAITVFSLGCLFLVLYEEYQKY